MPFNVGLVCEIQVATVCLRLACECCFQVVVGFGAFEFHGESPLQNKRQSGSAHTAEGQDTAFAAISLID
jgi:hypothetical protein